MFNPAEASARIKEEFIDYITTAYPIADEQYRSIFRKELDEIIAKGAYLQINTIFKAGKSIETLMREGVLSPLFAELEAAKLARDEKLSLPIDRPLYLHQESAIRKATEGKNLVVSTGTGSGKTECFLIPIINELLREKEAGKLSDGVRAIIIYPMNALAFDQMKRIRALLKDYPDITFGVYNGSTEHEADAALRVYKSLIKEKPLSSERLSREEMQAKPPHLLFTNYAMLEHLLLRPKEDVLFSRSDFKYIVLDEAHIYSGATGMETALLIRRMKARIARSKKTQFILTSATLGSGTESDADIVDFAKKLCGEEFYAEDIIRATREEVNFSKPQNNYPITLFTDLAEKEIGIAEICVKYNIPFGSNEKECYYDICENSPFYLNLIALSQRNDSLPIDLKQAASYLKITERQLIAFIDICTQAEKKSKSLLDARYHYFVRALEGAFVNLYGDKNLFLQRKQSVSLGKEEVCVFEIAVCGDCGTHAIVGTEINKRLVQSAKPTDEIAFYFIKNSEDDYFFNDEEGEPEDSDENKDYCLCTICGAIVPFNEKHRLPCDCGKEFYITVTKIVKDSGEKCAACGVGRIKRFYLGNDAATSVLCTSLFEQLPETERIFEVKQGATTNRFLQGTAKAVETKKIGKRFLSFSDSRQEAAFFACYMDSSYKEFLRRRGIFHIIQNNPDWRKNPVSVDIFASELANYFNANRSFALSNDSEGQNIMTLCKQNAWIAMLNEMFNARRRTSLTSLGQMYFEYIANNDNICGIAADILKISKENAKTLLDMLVMDIVYNGAINTDVKIDGNDWEYIFYYPDQKTLAMTGLKDKKKRTVANWLGKKRENGTYYPNRRIKLITSIAKVNDDEANEFLKEYGGYLIDKGINSAAMELIGNIGYVMPAKYFNVRIFGDQQAKWYVCSKCARVTTHNIENQCASIKCGGKLSVLDVAKFIEGNHYANLYSRTRMSPLFIKEHTAQLSRKESADYQQQFIENKINALSCSTTFEMGVDVGDLETVFMRNVPPSPANYAQRAGRAGRTKNAAAFALTYAKLSSHDFTYYKEPPKMISGRIMPPKFDIENEKVVMRHIYAVTLSYFFNETEYNRNNPDVFLNQGGYERLCEMLERKPDDLKDLLIRSFPEMYRTFGIEDYSWTPKLIGKEGVLKLLVEDYHETINNLNLLREGYRKQGDDSEAAKITRSINQYNNFKLIEFLARGNVLPKYGFPVDTAELYQAYNLTSDKKLTLVRDLQMAIAEYAPGAEVVADGKVYTSRYIKKIPSKDGRNDWGDSYVAKCDNDKCGTYNYSRIPIDKDRGRECCGCGKRLFLWGKSIEPRRGFIADHTVIDKVPMRKPDKSYRSDYYYIGDGKTIKAKRIKFGDKEIIAQSTVNDSMLIVSEWNRNNDYFYVCQTCGYAIGKHDRISDKQADRDRFAGANRIKYGKHKNQMGYVCVNEYLHRYRLHHTFKTDVVSLKFAEGNTDYDTMLSTMYAILEAISQTLSIKREDINGCLHIVERGGLLQYSIILFDSVPGGAGHVKRLITDDGMVFSKVMNAAYNKVKHCGCNGSCYGCLRTYYNQKIHDHLKRESAEEFLKAYTVDVSEITSCEDEINKQAPVIKIVNEGISLQGKTFDWILDYIEDDTSNIETLKSIELLKELTSIKPYLTPDCEGGKISINELQVSFALIWKAKKILVFFETDSFNEYGKNARDWDCFYLNEIDVQKLLKLIEV